MKIGIGLPATIPGVSGERILDWARRADAGPFSSVGIIDRLVYPNHEPLITLAAVAGATERVRLMTTILLAPIRNAAILAKQAATLDSLSGGRLTLGLSVGGREDDYLAAGVPFKGRGKRFDGQLAKMKRIWAGETGEDGAGPAGPPPSQAGGPELLIGGSSPVSIRRVGLWGDGLIVPGTPDSVRVAYEIAEKAWEAEGREETPRLVGAAYYALGPDAGDRASEYIHDYYSFMGPAADYVAGSVLSTPDAVQATIRDFSGIGMDELIFWPTVPDLDQVDRLAELAT